MSSLQAPQAPPRWTHTPAEVTDLTKAAIRDVKRIHNQITALPPKECNFESVFRKLSDAETILQDLEPLLFYQNVSPNKQLRDASSAAEVTVRDFLVEVEMDVAIFQAKRPAISRNF